MIARLPVVEPVNVPVPTVNSSALSSKPINALAALPLSNTKPTSPDGVPVVPVANSISLSDTVELVVSKEVTPPETVIVPATVKLPATLNPSPAPISTCVESVDLITLPAILIEPAVILVTPAIVVALAPRAIEVDPTVTVELARFAFVIPALPDNIEFVTLDSVLFEALILLFVSVFVVPENKVSN